MADLVNQIVGKAGSKNLGWGLGDGKGEGKGERTGRKRERGYARRAWRGLQIS